MIYWTDIIKKHLYNIDIILYKNLSKLNVSGCKIQYVIWLKLKKKEKNYILANMTLFIA